MLDKEQIKDDGAVSEDIDREDVDKPSEEKKFD